MVVVVVVGRGGVRAARGRRRRAAGREAAARQHDRDGEDGAVELRFVHVRDGGFGRGRVAVHDVGGAAVGHELAVDGHVEVLYPAVGAEDLAQVVFVDVLGELLDDDL